MLACLHMDLGLAGHSTAAFAAVGSDIVVALAAAGAATSDIANFVSFTTTLLAGAPVNRKRLAYTLPIQAAGGVNSTGGPDAQANKWSMAVKLSGGLLLGMAAMFCRTSAVAAVLALFLLIAPTASAEPTRPGALALVACVADASESSPAHVPSELYDCSSVVMATYSCYFGQGDREGYASPSDYARIALQGAADRHVVYPTHWWYGTVYYDSYKYLWCFI